jgi:hypothetical protein
MSIALKMIKPLLIEKQILTRVDADGFMKAVEVACQRLKEEKC